MSRPNTRFVCLEVERLEVRVVPAGLIYSGAGIGASPVVTISDPAQPGENRAFLAYTNSMTVGVTVAAADLTGDGVADIVTAPATGGVAQVKVFDGVTLREIVSFQVGELGGRIGPSVAAVDELIVVGPGAGSAGPVRLHRLEGGQVVDVGTLPAFAQGFEGGVTVAASSDAIAVGAWSGGGPHVRVFDRATLAELGSFMAYDPGFRGGVSVALADLDGDGRSEVVTGAGPGGGPHVRIFNVTGTELAGFMAYDPTFRGGVSVAVADLDGDGRSEIVTGAGPGGSPHVRIFDRNGVEQTGFLAFDASARGGVRVAATTTPLVSNAPNPTPINDIPPTAPLPVTPTVPMPVIVGMAGTAEPFQTLTIRGEFVSGQPVTVVFSDGNGYRVEIDAEETSPGVLTVVVPPVFDPATRPLTTDDVTVSVTVVQAGQTSGAKPLTVAGVPLTTAPAGTLITGWGQIFYDLAVTDGSFEESELSSWKKLQDGMTALMDGKVAVLDLAALGLGEGVIRREDLAVMDRLLAAAVRTNLPLTPVANAAQVVSFAGDTMTLASTRMAAQTAASADSSSNTAKTAAQQSLERQLVSTGTQTYLAFAGIAAGSGLIVFGVLGTKLTLGQSLVAVGVGFILIQMGWGTLNKLGSERVLDDLIRLIISDAPASETVNPPQVPVTPTPPPQVPVTPTPPPQVPVNPAPPQVPVNPAPPNDNETTHVTWKSVRPYGPSQYGNGYYSGELINDSASTEVRIEKAPDEEGESRYRLIVSYHYNSETFNRAGNLYITTSINFEGVSMPYGTNPSIDDDSTVRGVIRTVIDRHDYKFSEQRSSSDVPGSPRVDFGLDGLTASLGGDFLYAQNMTTTDDVSWLPRAVIDYLGFLEQSVIA